MTWALFVFNLFIHFFFQDKSADFSLTSSVGIKNNILALLVLGVYEVSTQVVVKFCL